MAKPRLPATEEEQGRGAQGLFARRKSRSGADPDPKTRPTAAGNESTAYTASVPTKLT